MPKSKKRLFIDHNHKEFEHFVTIMKGQRGLLFCSSFYIIQQLKISFMRFHYTVY